MRRPAVALIATLLVVAHATASAQERASAHQPSEPPQRGIDDARLTKRNVSVVLAEALAVAWYGKQNWWQDGFGGDFRVTREGWFGQHTMAGGADKLGHFYTSYVGTRLLAKAFTHIGNDPDAALVLGAAVTFGTMMAVEVADGYSRHWRFSREDAVMNAFGTAAGILLERSPRLDGVVDLRVHYLPSEAGGKQFDPFGDYSGLTYLVAFKASGWPALRKRPVLRYLEFSIGYGTSNYEDRRPDLIGERRRQVYAGVSLNLAELLGATVYRHRPGAASREVAGTLLEYVQVPGSAIFARRRIP